MGKCVVKVEIFCVIGLGFLFWRICIIRVVSVDILDGFIFCVVIVGVLSWILFGCSGGCGLLGIICLLVIRLIVFSFFWI